MDKRYQVFISSTYVDLRTERDAVFQTLMKMDCMPAGMELFPAADEDQFDYIKKIIDDSDYYLLIIGGRYGSTTEEGISYTELEYDYAVERGVKVLALLHGALDEIVTGKTDKDSSLSERLNAFRKKAEKGRLVNYWKDSNELKSQVVLGLHHMIHRFPAVGWVRGGKIGSEDLLIEINDLRKENVELRNQVADFKGKTLVVPNDIAGMHESFTMDVTFRARDDGQSCLIRPTLTWEKIFSIAAPNLISKKDEGSFKEILSMGIAIESGADARYPSINANHFQTIKVQLIALGLIETSDNPQANGLQLQLTKSGLAAMVAITTVKSKAANA
jgi:hypothetical protein